MASAYINQASYWSYYEDRFENRVYTGLSGKDITEATNWDPFTTHELKIDLHCTTDLSGVHEAVHRLADARSTTARELGERNRGSCPSPRSSRSRQPAARAAASEASTTRRSPIRERTSASFASTRGSMASPCRRHGEELADLGQRGRAGRRADHT